MTDKTTHYDDAFAALLEEIWGEGYLSPGGPDEVARILTGLDLAGRTVLDIGCGTGAIAVSLVRDHGAAQAVGIDVEPTVIQQAEARAAEAGVAERVRIEQVTPGPLPFDAGTFDLVFSKDSIIHIHDKETLAQEVFRVLRAGGHFAASDWLSSHDDPPTPQMQRYLDLEDMDFTMASARRWEQALEAAGFGDISTLSRNAWYRDLAGEELETLKGAKRPALEARCGAQLVTDNVEIWTAMVHVLQTGELCPTHLRAHKPA